MKTPVKELSIVKASGKEALYSRVKLIRSLHRSGLKEETIQQVVNEVEEHLYPGISTKEIFKRAYAILKDLDKPIAGRYKLKTAIMELGPSGFPFERFVAALLEKNGYLVDVGKTFQGKCVSHEVDVQAIKHGKVALVECKFHNHRGIYCDVKVPLYIRSRFVDVNDQFNEAWIVTNTRFSDDAISYAECIGIKLIGWDFPNGGSLRNQIDEFGLHPVTCLSGITRAEKQKILDLDVVLLRELMERPGILDKIGLSKQRKEKVIREAGSICTHYEK